MAQDDNSSFFVDRNSEIDDAGVIQSVTTIIRIEGNVRKTTASPTADRTAEWISLPLAGPVTVTVNLDGTPKLGSPWTPATSFGSPVVIRAETLIDPGGGESHWRVAATIKIVQSSSQAAGTTSETSSIISFRGEITTVKNPLDQVVKKVWRMGAQGKTLQDATTFVIGFKPSGTKVRQEFQRDGGTNEARATWVWDAQRTDELISIVETIKIVGGGADWIEGPRVGQAGQALPSPVIHVARRKTAMILVAGVAIGYVPGIGPSSHYTPGASIRRWGQRETNDFPVIENVELGTFTAPYQETYIATGDIPAPDHGDHGEFVVISEPADGEILTFAG